MRNISPRGQDRGQVTRSAKLFAALGDGTRLWLVDRLCEDGPSSITKLTSGAGVTRQAVTKHLRAMEAVGLISSSRQGRTSYWRLEEQRLEEARRQLNLISKQWDETLSRLKKHLEG